MVKKLSTFANLCGFPKLHFLQLQEALHRFIAHRFNRPTDKTVEGRRNFKHVHAIDDSLFVQLVLNHFDPKGKRPPGACKVIDRDDGSNNYCVTVMLEDDDCFVIRVPAIGTKEAWTDEDAFNLHNEVESMGFIREQTKVPVPVVYKYSTGFDNILGAPFVLMGRVRGLSACWHLWYDRKPDGSAGIDLKGADNPSPALERKRQHFLKSLANTMVKLNKLQFDKMGMLHFESDHLSEDDNEEDYELPPPTVGHWFKHVRGEGMVKREAYSSTAEYFNTIKEEIAKEDFSRYQDDQERDLRRAYARVATLVCDSFPRSVPMSFGHEQYDTEPETFVLAHDDLDLQNIYVDHQGNIKGIIDWSGVRTKPRWAGWSALPVFLRKDWEPEYDVDTTGHWPWKLKKYRQDYERYLQEALGSSSSSEEVDDDTQFTLVSGATWAALEMLEYPAWRVSVIDQLLRQVPPLRTADHQQFLLWLGGEERWKDGEAILTSHLPDLFM